MLKKILSRNGQLISECPLPVFDVQATRTLESMLAATLPPHALMQRAGSSVAMLARAVAPHARTIWIACGPGNNGGDGLMAAALLADWAKSIGAQLCVTWFGNENQMPADAQFALRMARQANVLFLDQPPEHCDLGIDALLGLGNRASKAQETSNVCHIESSDPIEQCVHDLHTRSDALICVDLPTGLNAETGYYSIANYSYKTSVKHIFCLTFITLKPGLFTAQGRDHAGEIWLDDLGLSRHLDAQPQTPQPRPVAWLGLHHPVTGDPAAASAGQARHDTHKGQLGDVWILGGQGLHPTGAGMCGAAMLAAKAALHGKAGRVMVALLDEHSPSWDVTQPELMLRNVRMLQTDNPLPSGTWVCGCGGGNAIHTYLPKVLNEAPQLVLDADAINALSASVNLVTDLKKRHSRGQVTVLTPHPLEAARLLNWTTAQVQHNRLEAARRVAALCQCLCILKGSGTILATPSGRVGINTSGNAHLSTAGTGDVLAGIVGASLAHIKQDRHRAITEADGPHENSAEHDVHLDFAVLPAVAAAVWTHGRVADEWSQPYALTASQLARMFTPPTSIPPATQ